VTRPGWAGAGRGPAARRSVVVLGSANVDLVVSVDRRPGAGETVLGSDVRTFAGGKGANQAVAAGRLGGRVTFAGCVGRDAGAGLLRGSLAAAGVDLTHLRESAAPTGTALILLTPDGENSIVVSPGANRMVTADLVAELDEVWPHAAVLVVQLEIPMETVELAVRRAAQAGVRVVVNAAPAAALSSHALKRADPLVVNETEAAFLLGLRPGTAAGDGTEGDDGDRGGGGGGGDDDDDGEAVLAAGRLLAAGARSVVLTLGSRGAVAAEHDGSDGGRRRAAHVRAQPVAAVDTTGAGDAFVGALAVCLAEGTELESAVHRAGLVAADSVTRHGAQESYPRREEIWP